MILYWGECNIWAATSTFLSLWSCWTSDTWLVFLFRFEFYFAQADHWKRSILSAYVRNWDLSGVWFFRSLLSSITPSKAGKTEKWYIPGGIGHHLVTCHHYTALLCDVKHKASSFHCGSVPGLFWSTTGMSSLSGVQANAILGACYL